MSQLLSAVAGASMVLTVTHNPEWSMMVVAALVAATIAKVHNQ